MSVSNKEVLEKLINQSGGMKGFFSLVLDKTLQGIPAYANISKVCLVILVKISPSYMGLIGIYPWIRII